MHRTPSGDRKKALKRDAQELARDAKAEGRRVPASFPPGNAKAARRGGEGPGTGRGPSGSRPGWRTCMYGR